MRYINVLKSTLISRDVQCHLKSWEFCRSYYSSFLALIGTCLAHVSNSLFDQVSSLTISKFKYTLKPFISVNMNTVRI